MPSALRIQLEGRLEALEQATQRLHAASDELSRGAPLAPVDVEGADDAVRVIEAKLAVTPDAEATRAVAKWLATREHFVEVVQKVAREAGLRTPLTSVEEAWALGAHHLPVRWKSREQARLHASWFSKTELGVASLVVLVMGFFAWRFTPCFAALVVLGFFTWPLLLWRKRREVPLLVLTQSALIINDGSGERVNFERDLKVEFAEVPGAVWVHATAEGRSRSWRVSPDDGYELATLVAQRWPGRVMGAISSPPASEEPDGPAGD